MNKHEDDIMQKNYTSLQVEDSQYQAVVTLSQFI